MAFLRAVAHPDDSVSLHYLASSDLYQVPIVDLTRCATYADRKHRWLFDVLRAVDGSRAGAELSEGRGWRSAASSPTSSATWSWRARCRPASCCTSSCVDSGLADPHVEGARPRATRQEVQNVCKFFRRIQDASTVLRYDNVREFVNHLDALIEAGEDPAVAEADGETPAVHVLTVHKAKGLELPVVFLVNCVQSKFPVARGGPSRSSCRPSSSRTRCPRATSICRRSGGSSTWA